MNAQTLTALVALTATLTASSATLAATRGSTTSTTPTIETALYSADLSGSWVDLKPIGVVTTDTSGYVGLKPIGWIATAGDGSVELKPIGREYQSDIYDFAWAVEPADVSTSTAAVAADYEALEPVAVITLMGQDGYDGSEIGLKPIGIVADEGGYTDLKPIGLETMDSGSVSLKPIGVDESPIGLETIGYGTVDSDGYVELGQMGEVTVQYDGGVEIPVSTTTTSSRSRDTSYSDYYDTYTSTRTR